MNIQQLEKQLKLVLYAWETKEYIKVRDIVKQVAVIELNGTYRSGKYVPNALGSFQVATRTSIVDFVFLSVICMRLI